MELEGKTVLVTGASRGIGAALARELPPGRPRACRPARRRARRAHGSRVARGDRRVVRRAGDELGEIDVLINNAGAFTAGQLETQDVGDLYDVFQVNLVGLAHLTRRVLPTMLERGSGKIVNHSSLVAYFRFPGVSTYSASKAGVTAFTDCLRRELRGTGVTTLEVVTGGVDTEMLDRAAGQLSGHTDPSGWQWMSPDDWAGRIVDAIERDEQTLQPPGKSRLGKALSRAPAFVLDAISARGFERR